MTKLTFENSLGLTLVADYFKGSSTKTIIMCHGFTGERHENGFFDDIAEKLHQEGFTIFNFDFSGSGESEDQLISVEKELDDLECAISYVKQFNPESIGIIGHSLGGLVSCTVNSSDITTMALTAPVTAKKENYGKYKFTPEQITEFEEKGYCIKIRPGAIREIYKIDKKIIQERETVNQNELLTKISVPILICHGDKDSVIPIQDSKNAMKYLLEDSKLIEVPETGHGFEVNRDIVLDEIVKWFREKL